MPGLPATEVIVAALCRDLFAGMSPPKPRWHDDDRYDGVMCGTRLWLHRDFEFEPRRDKLCALLVHELCHRYVASEKADHGPRFQSALRARGVDFATGAIVVGGKLWSWLRDHPW